jgi:hypothetical protein
MGSQPIDVVPDARLDPPSRDPFVRQALHLFALTGFALAQPLFDVLGRHPTFFVAHGFGSSEAIVFAVALIVVPPAALAAAVFLVRLISLRAARFVHLCLVGTLVWLAAAPVLARAPWPSVAIILFLVVSVGSAFVYARFQALRRYLTVLAVAPVLFLVGFLVLGPARSLRGAAPAMDGVSVKSPAPIVMLQLDEFALGSILTPTGAIDGERFPNFARLAERSTWYPNATTNANDTEHALPSILTGTYPRDGKVPPAPTVGEYPRNLFTLLSHSHELKVGEWITSLCPAQSCDRYTVFDHPKHFVVDTALVYLHVVIPDRLAELLPALGHQWAGYFADPKVAEQRIRKLPAPLTAVGRRLLNWLADDEFSTLDRFERFKESIGPSRRPTLSFAHIDLPHVTWRLLPDTSAYDRRESPGLSNGDLKWSASSPLLNAGLQRCVMQVKATDHLVGELIDQLDATHQWDRSLVVVLADHGFVFAPQRLTRDVVGVEDQILPVPLFVKVPHQSSGGIDRRNAELIDVLPTILDVFDVDAPGRMDGASLVAPDPHRRTKRVWAWGQALPPYEPGVTKRPTGVSKYIRALFGKGGGKYDLFGYGDHRDLVGRRLDELEIETGEDTPSLTLFDEGSWRDVVLDRRSVPVRPTGESTGTPPKWVAVAVNGIVGGIGQPWTDGRRWRFSVMISDSLLKDGRNELVFIGVNDRGRLTRLRRDDGVT